MRSTDKMDAEEYSSRMQALHIYVQFTNNTQGYNFLVFDFATTARFQTPLLLYAEWEPFMMSQARKRCIGSQFWFCNVEETADGATFPSDAIRNLKTGSSRRDKAHMQLYCLLCE